MALLIWTQTHTLKLSFLPYKARLHRYIRIGSAPKNGRIFFDNCSRLFYVLICANELRTNL